MGFVVQTCIASSSQQHLQSIVSAWSYGDAVEQHCQSFIDRGQIADFSLSLSHTLFVSLSISVSHSLSFYLCLSIYVSRSPTLLICLILFYSSPSFTPPVATSHTQLSSLSFHFTFIEHLAPSLSSLSPLFLPPLSISLIYPSSTPESLTHTLHTHTHTRTHTHTHTHTATAPIQLQQPASHFIHQSFCRSEGLAYQQDHILCLAIVPINLQRRNRKKPKKKVLKSAEVIVERWQHDCLSEQAAELHSGIGWTGGLCGGAMFLQLAASAHQQPPAPGPAVPLQICL